ncbi:hypothetical protein FA13DRAFT_1738220 [Coprinellus micaceus]|uniref:Uncharacterized protein n=1 Tax=Coprinellus micaceus TaxID=71717 RepID=A0A4Y7SV54_COPMI|nr:hypothetical protein FA13DRAFT_1738220 [Coprinellus micaceus]
MEPHAYRHRALFSRTNFNLILRTLQASPVPCLPQLSSFLADHNATENSDLDGIPSPTVGSDRQGRTHSTFARLQRNIARIAELASRPKISCPDAQGVPVVQNNAEEVDGGK